MFRIGPENLLGPERPGKVAESEGINRDLNRREPNGRRRKSGKGRQPAEEDSPAQVDEHGVHPGDETGEVGGRVDFEA